MNIASSLAGADSEAVALAISSACFTVSFEGRRGESVGADTTELAGESKVFGEDAPALSS